MRMVALMLRIRIKTEGYLNFYVSCYFLYYPWEMHFDVFLFSRRLEADLYGM